MKDGYKIVDVDSHMMEPEWLWERHIEDRYKSAAPKMGIAPASGRRTFLVEGEPFTRDGAGRRTRATCMAFGSV